MGDVFSPKPLTTGQQGASDTFSNILDEYLKGQTPTVGGTELPGFLGGGTVGGTQLPDSIGGFLGKFNLPGYEGDLSAGKNGLQTSSLAGGEKAINDFFSGGGLDSITKSLTGVLEGTGGSFGSVDDVYKALDAQRRQGLSRDLGDLQEQFGVSGLGDSTSQYESAARKSTESEQNLMAEVARIAPQLGESLSNQKINAAQTLAGLPIAVAQQGFNLGESGRGVDQGNLDRMYQEFIRKSGLLPLLFQFLGNTGERNYAPSTFQNLTSGAASAGALASGLSG